MNKQNVVVPEIGTDLYVPRTNLGSFTEGKGTGGLATIKGIRQVMRSGKDEFMIQFAGITPVFYLSALHPAQEELKKEYGSQRAPTVSEEAESATA